MTEITIEIDDEILNQFHQLLDVSSDPEKDAFNKTLEKAILEYISAHSN